MDGSIEIDEDRDHDSEREQSRSGSVRHDQPIEKEYEIVEPQRSQAQPKPQVAQLQVSPSTYGNDSSDAPVQQRSEVVVETGNKESGKTKKNNNKPKNGNNKKEPCLTLLDKSNRDPNHIAENFRVTFEDIIAEPDDTLHSFDQVWQVSKLVFTETRTWVYRVISLLLGVIIAIVWGLVFAVLSFAASWLFVPSMKVYRSVMSYIKPYVVIYVDCCCEPWVTVGSKIFYNIRVFNVAKDPED